MLDSIKSIEQRIADIERMFSKKDAPAITTSSKSFSEYLNAQMGGETAVTSPTDAQKAFVPEPIGRDISAEVHGGDYSVQSRNGYEIYKQRQEVAPVTAFDGIISEAARRYHIPETLIKAVIRQESNFKPEEVSTKGAVGLMQIMPSTAAELGLDVGNLTDPSVNIMGGTRLLNDLMSKYEGNLPKALAAYNAGERAVDQAKGIPAYPETVDYVQKVLDFYGKYNNHR
ncbi:MAG: lytic transglycosylase domain-containing protein [Spirochaetes bacterium]|nr:lytic transglycosylase domain-containing protein [Spirochaetota bacterium]